MKTKLSKKETQEEIKQIFHGNKISNYRGDPLKGAWFRPIMQSKENRKPTFLNLVHQWIGVQLCTNQMPLFIN